MWFDRAKSNVPAANDFQDDVKKDTTMDNRLANRFRKWRSYRKTYNELKRLSERDLDDLGISRMDIRSISRQSVI